MNKSMNSRAWALVAAFGGLATVVACASTDLGSDQAAPAGGEDAVQVNGATAAGTLDTAVVNGILRENAAIIQAARTQLASFVASIPAGEEAEYGFGDRSEFGKATFAAPYELVELVADGSTKPLEQWIVPVLVDGEYRVMSEVKREGSGFHAFSFGGARLTQQLGLAEQARSAMGAPIQSRVILRSFQNAADFVVYDVDARQAKSIDASRAFALESARVAFAAKLDTLQLSQQAPAGMRGILPMTVLKALVAH